VKRGGESRAVITSEATPNKPDLCPVKKEEIVEATFLSSFDLVILSEGKASARIER
jgi:hypothetical protein